MKRLSLLFVSIIFIASLCGCIISATPTEPLQFLSVGETKKFAIKVIQPYQGTIEWELDGEHIENNDGKSSFYYSPTQKDVGVHILNGGEVDRSNGGISTQFWQWIINVE